MIRFLLNRDEVSLDCPPGRVLLDVLRTDLGLTGTKEGCREGDCGACLVLVGELEGDAVRYQAANSCLLPAGRLQGCHVVTIEGLNQISLTPVQKVIVDEGATQCGFCTPGLVMALTGFLLNSAQPDPERGMEAAAGNICRCTGYMSIRRAIRRLCEEWNAAGFAGNGDSRMGSKDDFLGAHLAQLASRGVIPEYFLEIPGRLRRLADEPAIEAAIARSSDATLPGRGMSDERCTDPRSLAPETSGTDEIGPQSRETREIIVGGGTDLFVQRPEVLERSPLRFTDRIPGLREIRDDGGSCFIGGACTVTDLLESRSLAPVLQDLRDDLLLMASEPIRNRATIAGNLINASPIGDLTILLLALDARLHLRILESPGRATAGEPREIPLKEFYLGYKTLDLKPGEILEGVSFAWPGQDSRISFEKVSRRRHLDIASVNSALMLRLEEDPPRIVEAHLSAGGVAPIPLYLGRVSQALAGIPIEGPPMLKALQRVEEEISPISDVRGSALYKTLLLKRLIRAHLIRIFPQLAPELAP